MIERKNSGILHSNEKKKIVQLSAYLVCKEYIKAVVIARPEKKRNQLAQISYNLVFITH